MLDKEEVLGIAKTHMMQKIAGLQLMFDDLTDALKTSTKSSAGDKHETSRAMTQLEQEKLGKQLKGLVEMIGTLDQINPNKEHNTVEFGSLVSTTKGAYFISVGLGAVTSQKEKIFCISPVAPLGQLLIGKKAGDQIDFNNQVFDINSVI